MPNVQTTTVNTTAILAEKASRRCLTREEIIKRVNALSASLLRKALPEEEGVVSASRPQFGDSSETNVNGVIVTQRYDGDRWVLQKDFHDWYSW